MKVHRLAYHGLQLWDLVSQGISSKVWRRIWQTPESFDLPMACVSFPKSGRHFALRPQLGAAGLETCLQLRHRVQLECHYGIVRSQKPYHINTYTHIYTYVAVTRNRGLSRSPLPPVTYLCREPSVTNPCRGPLCRALWSSIGLWQGGFVARPPNSVTSLVAKRPRGPVTGPMFLRRCHMCICICVDGF